MEFHLKPIILSEHLFRRTTVQVKKNIDRVSYVAGGGIGKTGMYPVAIKKFSEQLEDGLDENTDLSWKDILYVLNELVVNRSYFNDLKDFDDLDAFISLTRKYKKVSISKNLFKLYFNYYSVINTELDSSFLKKQLKSILRNYSGRNKYLQNLVSIKDYLFGDLSKLLEYYNNDFNALSKDLKLQESYEFSKMLLNLKIVQELNSLDYDEENERIFSSILERKNIFFTNGLVLKEYVAKKLINIAMEEQKPFPNWQKFILELIDDPRGMANNTTSLRSWEAVGSKRKDYFIKTLSKDDLKLFLNVLSASNADNNYEYRRAFWMQFLDKVVFTKILLGPDVLHTLSDEMKQKFKLNNDSYGRITGLHNQSAVYIDFGRIKVIEFTHSGKVRGFSECPINLHKKTYSKVEIDSLQNSSINLFSQIHSSPATYSWQEALLPYMNQYLGSNVTKQDVEIDSDRTRREAYMNSRR